jgi:hypothetical protein
MGGGDGANARRGAARPATRLGRCVRTLTVAVCPADRGVKLRWGPGLLREVRAQGWAASEDPVLQAAWVHRAVLEVWRAAVATRDATILPDVLAAAHAAFGDADALDAAQAAWSFEVRARAHTHTHAHIHTYMHTCMRFAQH